MSYDLTGRALVPISKLLDLLATESMEFPLSQYISTDPLDEVTSGLYFIDPSVSYDTDNIILEMILAFQTEVVLGLPGGDSLAIVLCSAGDGWTAISCCVVIGPDFSMRFQDATIGIRFGTDILADVETEDPAQIEFVTDIQFSSERVVVDYSEGGLQLKPAYIFGTDIITEIEGLIPVFGTMNPIGLELDEGFEGICFDKMSVEIPADYLQQDEPLTLSIEDGAIGTTGFLGTLVLDEELVIALPGVDNFGLVLGKDEESSFRIEATVDQNGNFSFQIQEIDVALLIDANILRPLETGTSNAIINVESLEIPLGTMSFGIDAEGNITLLVDGDISIPRCMVGESGIIISADEFILNVNDNGTFLNVTDGTLTFPGMVADKEIEMSLEVSPDTFEIAVSNLPPLNLGPLELKLDEFILNVYDNGDFYSVTDGKLAIPGIVTDTGEDIEVSLEVSTVGTDTFEIKASNLPPFEVAGIITQLTCLEIKFNTTGIDQTQIEGTIEVPAFNDTDQPINITVDIDDGFGITAQIPDDGLEVFDVAGIIATLWSLHLAIGTDWIEFGLSGSIDNSITVPLVSDLVPSKIVVDNLGIDRDNNLILDLEIEWPSGLKASPDAEGIFTVDIPVGEFSSDIRVDAVRLQLEPVNSDYSFTILFLGASAQLGPVLGMIDGFGLSALFKPCASGGNLGPLDVSLALEPPNAIGIEVRDDSIEVGGVLNYEGDKNLYSGVVHVRSGGIRVHAFGIYKQLPDGSPSLVVAGGATFPPIPLFAGITLTGAGALVGVNRRLNADELRTRIRSGGVANLLQAPDPVDNASQLLADIAEILPPSKNVHCIGVSLQLSFMMVHGDFGLIFELADGDNEYGSTGVTKILILGSTHLVYPESGDSKGDYIEIHNDSVGIIDLVRKKITHDGSLYNSTLFFFDIYGDNAVVINYGNQPFFLVSVGGVHPAYQPEPFEVPDMRRAGMSGTIDRGWLSVTLTLETYLAITSTAVMFGAEVRVNATFKEIVEANLWLGFDALLQFEPFYFSILAFGGVELNVFGFDLAEGFFTATLSGPGPMLLDFTIGYSLFFGLIKDSHHGFVMLDSGAPQIPEYSTVDAVGAMVEELSRASNLKSVEVGGEGFVLLRNPESGMEIPIVSPRGHLRWSQKRLPLDCLCDRIDGKPLLQPQTVDVRITSGEQGAMVTGWFAPSAYAEIDRGRALNGSGFENLKAGFEFSWSGSEEGRTETVTVDIKTSVLEIDVVFYGSDRPTPPLGVALTAKARSQAATIGTRPAAIKANSEIWEVVATGGEMIVDRPRFDAQQRAYHGGGIAIPSDDAVEYSP